MGLIGASNKKIKGALSPFKLQSISILAPQPNTMNISFCALIGILLTKLSLYFDESTDSNMFFCPLKVALNLVTLFF